jgi:hypothetical protein
MYAAWADGESWQYFNRESGFALTRIQLLKAKLSSGMIRKFFISRHNVAANDGKPRDAMVGF